MIWPLVRTVKTLVRIVSDGTCPWIPAFQFGSFFIHWYNRYTSFYISKKNSIRWWECFIVMLGIVKRKTLNWKFIKSKKNSKISKILDKIEKKSHSVSIVRGPLSGYNGTVELFVSNFSPGIFFEKINFCLKYINMKIVEKFL